ncbi:hypothetical protein [Streptomyces sp. NBC_00648]|uniref:hypothetical protein n=1 Tax=Streptomyces sp. NBC_00648 TaxID=2975797 RepID=UPI0032455928
MSLPMWEVDVPMRMQGRPRPVGLHIFLGRADSPSGALKAAREAYTWALLLRRAGREIPRSAHRGGWAARGLRADCDLDWERARTELWVRGRALPLMSFGV